VYQPPVPSCKPSCQVDEKDPVLVEGFEELYAAILEEVNYADIK
jgi:hypothetical protein